jgi:hypothetical protein
MVLIITATCAGMGVLSAISAQAGPLRPPWPLQPDSLFPVLSRWQLKDAGTGRATSVAPLALGLLRSEEVGSLPCPQFTQ